MRLLNQIINDTDTLPGRLFDIFIQLLIVLSLATFSIETLPDLSTASLKLLHQLEFITVLIFSIEYVLRIIVSEKSLKYIFSFYGLVDIFAILPFYLSTGGLDLRIVRSFRLMRLFRIFKLTRYSEAMKRFRDAFTQAKEELVLFFSITLIILYLSSVGIYYFEHTAQPEVFKSIFHSLWWAVSTLTTVGYGDIYPVTVGGKLFTFVILMIGLGVVAVPAGILASALTKVNRK
jgi:voltage-gated potassium channel